MHHAPGARQADQAPGRVCIRIQTPPGARLIPSDRYRVMRAARHLARQADQAAYTLRLSCGRAIVTSTSALVVAT
jgi:hypothetical protein